MLSIPFLTTCIFSFTLNYAQFEITVHPVGVSVMTTVSAAVQVGHCHLAMLSCVLGVA